jgi:ribonucleoside-triphosphate reductase
MLKQGMMPVYDAGFVHINKQFLTLGVNGFSDGAEFLGYEISANEEYLTYQEEIFSKIKSINTEMSKEYGVRYGTEIIPAENLGVKNAEWDKKDGLIVRRDCYNSYFYFPEEDDNYIDKMTMHGGRVCKSLDGGQALHDNEDHCLTYHQYMNKFTTLVRSGCNYYTANVKETCCNNCNTNTPDTFKVCPKCGSDDIDYATKIIGYVKRVKAFSEPRQEEESRRHYGL